MIRAGRREDISVKWRAADVDDATAVAVEYYGYRIAELGRSAVIAVEIDAVVLRRRRGEFGHQRAWSRNRSFAFSLEGCFTVCISDLHTLKDCPGLRSHEKNVLVLAVQRHARYTNLST